jgi:hypothetical protein
MEAEERQAGEVGLNVLWQTHFARLLGISIRARHRFLCRCESALDSN